MGIAYGPSLDWKIFPVMPSPVNQIKNSYVIACVTVVTTVVNSSENVPPKDSDFPFSYLTFRLTLVVLMNAPVSSFHLLFFASWRRILFLNSGSLFPYSICSLALIPPTPDAEYCFSTSHSICFPSSLLAAPIKSHFSTPNSLIFDCDLCSTGQYATLFLFRPEFICLIHPFFCGALSWSLSVCFCGGGEGTGPE